MKTFIVVAALGCLSLPMQALAADQSKCTESAKGFADVVVRTRQLPEANRQSLILDLARKEDFKTVGSRMGARSLNLVDTSLTQREIETDLYAYCMNQ